MGSRGTGGQKTKEQKDKRIGGQGKQSREEQLSRGTGGQMVRGTEEQGNQGKGSRKIILKPDVNRSLTGPGNFPWLQICI
jgi:hypothetical protein